VKAPSYNETGFITTTPPSSTVLIPDNVAAKTGEVFCHSECGIPMYHVGSDGQEHDLNVVRKRGNVRILMAVPNIVLCQWIQVYFNTCYLRLKELRKPMIFAKIVKILLTLKFVL